MGGEIINNGNEVTSKTKVVQPIKDKEVNPLAIKLQELRAEAREHNQKLSLASDCLECKNTEMSEEAVKKINSKEGMTELLEQIKKFDEEKESLTPLEFLQKSEEINKKLNNLEPVYFYQNKSDLALKKAEEESGWFKKIYRPLNGLNKTVIKLFPEWKAVKERQAMEENVKALEIEAKKKEIEVVLREQFVEIGKELPEEREKVYKNLVVEEIGKLKSSTDEFMEELQIGNSLYNKKNVTVIDNTSDNALKDLVLFSIKDELPDIVKKYYDILNQNRDENSHFVWDVSEHFSFHIKNFWGKIDNWQNVKNSEFTKEVFGSIVNEADKVVFQELIDATLMDITSKENSFVTNINDMPEIQVNNIMALEKYPFPEAVRNLILIASGGSIDSNKRWAGETLKKITEKSDWKEILDETIREYPELPRNMDDIDKVGIFDDFFLSQLEIKNKDINKMASLALPITTKTNFLLKNNVITDNDCDYINNLAAQYPIEATKNAPGMNIAINQLLNHLIIQKKYGEDYNGNSDRSIDINFVKLQKLNILAKEIVTNINLTEKEVDWLMNCNVHPFIMEENISLESVRAILGDEDKYSPESSLFDLLDYWNYFEGLKQNKEFFVKAFGDNGEKFLKSLPNNEIERRNAFTYNKYDRTSKFFDFVFRQTSIKIDTKNIGYLADYVKDYGLSESPLVMDIFLKIKNNDLENLPEIAKISKIESTEDLKKLFDHVNLIVASDKIIDNATAQNLNPLEKEIIFSLTGYSKGSWGKTDFDTIIKNLPEKNSEYLFGHKATKFEVDTMKFEGSVPLTEEEQNNYSEALKEVVEATKNPSDISELKSNLKEIYNNYSKNMNFDKMPENIKEKNMAKLRNIADKIERATDIDSLMIVALDVLKQKIGKDDAKIASITRSLFFKKILTSREKISEGFIERIKNKLDISNDEITIEKIQQLRDMYRNYLKDHAMKDEDYWDTNTRIAIKESVKLNQKLNIGGTIETLDRIDKYIRENSEIDDQTEIESIPDGGLIGELSGYIGNACYTKVSPLLKQYENLTPYKFITKDPINNSTEVAGSCLVFEEKDKDGVPVLLVRALNIPNLENRINVGQFVEKFFDQLAVTAQERNVKKIIIAPTNGTISNYAGVTNYVIEKYVTGKEPIKLQKTFEFNEHDITNSCCVVREVDYNSL